MITLQQEKISSLESFNILKELSVNEKMQLRELTCVRKFSKGEVIYFPPDETKKIYYLKEGYVRLSRIMASGEEGLMEVIGPGELFGNYAAADDNVRNEVAAALQDCVIGYLDISTWSRFIEGNPNFSLSILKLAGLRLRRLQSRVEQLQFFNTSSRIRKVLKELADRYGRKIGLGYETELRLNLTHEDIAKLAGASRQSVTMELVYLEKKGILSYDRRRMLIRQYDEL